MEDKRVVGVRQHLGSIMQKNTFVAEDIRPFEEDDGGEMSDGSGEESEGEDGEEPDEAEGPAEAAEPELAWNDVFKGDEEEEPVTVFSKLEEESDDEDGELAPYTDHSDQTLKHDCRQQGGSSRFRC